MSVDHAMVERKGKQHDLANCDLAVANHGLVLDSVHAEDAQLRVMKNRFGNTNEVGIFEMTNEGLQEVKNPSQYFLDDQLEGSYGRSLTCILEGSRSLFVEIQALVVENKFGSGRRTTICSSRSWTLHVAN